MIQVHILKEKTAENQTYMLWTLLEPSTVGYSQSSLKTMKMKMGESNELQYTNALAHRRGQSKITAMDRFSHRVQSQGIILSQFSELCYRYYAILEIILLDVQENFHNNNIHTEDSFIRKENLSLITLLINLPIDSRNYEQTSPEELQLELAYDSDDSNNWK